MDSVLPIPVILGTTCSWKSAVAIAVAKQWNGEIISCDSMQVYRELPIGTAQPPPAEQEGIPHHLIGCLSLQERWDASRFVPTAQRLIHEIRQRGRLPVIVGGTGLYARALCYALELLPGDATLAAELREAIQSPERVQALQRELASGVGELPLDIRQNPRHLARAVEVFRLTGKAPWQLHTHPAQPLDGFRQFCLLPTMPLLKERIWRRTAAMLQAGWIEEAKRADKLGLATAPTAWQALGYREIRSFLAQGGTPDAPELLELLANATVRYARRQRTWFLHQHPGAAILEPTAEELAAADTAAALASRVLKSLS